MLVGKLWVLHKEGIAKWLELKHRGLIPLSSFIIEEPWLSGLKRQFAKLLKLIASVGSNPIGSSKINQIEWTCSSCKYWKFIISYEIIPYGECLLLGGYSNCKTICDGYVMQL